MIAQVPREGESPEAAEGTAAHQLAELCVGAYLLCGVAPHMVGQVADNGVVYTDEMQEAAEEYARIIVAILAPTGAQLSDPNVGLEQEMSIPDIHDENGGTPDFWFYDQKNGVIHVIDFKFGFLIVEAFENYQLINYLAGISGLFEINGLQDQEIRVELHVYQPRGYHPEGAHRIWRARLSDMRGYFNHLRLGAEESTRGGVARVGPHCLRCDARHCCEALRRATASATAMTYDATVTNLDGPSLGLELTYLQRAADLLEARISGLKSEGEQRARKGEVIPGWALQTAYGKRTWKNKAEAIGAGQLCGVDLTAEPKPVGIGEAKKRGMPEEMIEALTHKPSNGVKLTQDAGTLARKCFL